MEIVFDTEKPIDWNQAESILQKHGFSKGEKPEGRLEQFINEEETSVLLMAHRIAVQNPKLPAEIREDSPESKALSELRDYEKGRSNPPKIYYALAGDVKL